jgi:hypothetical protein
MAIFGDKDLKHFLKEPVSRDFYVQNETFKCEENLLNVDVHESYTLNKIVNEIVHPPTDSERYTLVMSNQRFFKIVCFHFPTNVPQKIEYIRF